MTQKQRRNLFGRLSNGQQQEAVEQAHDLADRHQEHACILVGHNGERVVFLTCLLSKAKHGPIAPARIVKHRDCRRRAIHAVFRQDAQARPAPWEGRGRHD